MLMVMQRCFESVEQRIDQGFGSKQLIPFFVDQVVVDDRGLSAVAFSHEFEEGIGLFGFKGEVAQLVNDEQIIAHSGG